MEMLLALGLSLVCGSAPGPVAIEAAIRPGRARPGGTVTIAIRLRIGEGFHVYAHDQDPAGGTPTTFEIQTPSLAPEGGYRGPQPKVHTEPVLQVELREYTGEAVLERTFRIEEDAPPGDLAIEGRARFQACTEDSCLLPEEEPFSLVLAVEAQPEAPPGEEAAKDERQEGKDEAGKEAAPAAPAEPRGIGSAPASGPAADPIAIDASVHPARARRGETLTIAVRFRIADGFHIYAHDQDPNGGKPTTFEIQTPSLVPEGGFRGPQPKVRTEPILQIEMREYYGEAVLERTFRIAEDAQPGDLAIEGRAVFQPCTEDSCLLPTERPFSLAAAIEAGGDGSSAKTEPAKADVQSPGPEDESEGVEGALARGFWAIIAVSAAAALLSLLTPCVFPMIPITISYFAQQAKSRARTVVTLAAAYALGIIGTYVGVGVVLVLAFQGTGLARIATSPWMNLFLALLFIVCGLSLLGFFELQLPQGLVGRLQAKGRSAGAGIAGTVLLGVSFTLVSFSCTGPIIGPLFGALATGSHRGVALAGIATYSVVFALPFFLLALFPKALSALPKSGGWLEVGKVTLGFVLLAVALKFASSADLVWRLDLLPRPLFLAGWSVLAALAGVYLLGILRVGKGGAEERAGPGRLLLGIAFLALAAFIAYGIGGRTLPGRIGHFIEAFPPPAEEIATAGNPGAAAPLRWLESYDEARERAKAEGMPLMVYFTGYTCVKCRQMERSIFPEPEVRGLMERFIRVKLHADAAGEEGARARALQAELVGAETVPVIRIGRPGTGEKLGMLAGGPKDAAAFVTFLRAALARAAGGG
ncbi:MAG: thioredoxin family protein [Planctomycetes bacterium]|nr:thioredoxin family protein [Planctomycetota bacterium]